MSINKRETFLNKGQRQKKKKDDIVFPKLDDHLVMSYCLT